MSCFSSFFRILKTPAGLKFSLWAIFLIVSFSVKFLTRKLITLNSLSDNESIVCFLCINASYFLFKTLYYQFIILFLKVSILEKITKDCFLNVNIYLLKSNI